MSGGAVARRLVDQSIPGHRLNVLEKLATDLGHARIRRARCIQRIEDPTHEVLFYFRLPSLAFPRASRLATVSLPLLPAPRGSTPLGRSYFPRPRPQHRRTHTQIWLCGAVQAEGGSDRPFCLIQAQTHSILLFTGSSRMSRAPLSTGGPPGKASKPTAGYQCSFSEGLQASRGHPLPHVWRRGRAPPRRPGRPRARPQCP